MSAPLPSPTPENVAAATVTLNNMVALNNNLHSYGKDQIGRAYEAFSAADNADLGLIFGLNVVEGALWAGGSELGPAGNFAASFFSGILSAFLGTPPDSLTQQFDTFRDRFEKTCLDVNLQLLGYLTDDSGNSNVAASWNQSVTHNGSTYAVGALCETANAFRYTADSLSAALYAVSKSVYTYLLKARYQIYCWTPNTSAPGTDQNTPPTAWMQVQYKEYPAYYYTYTWVPATRCKGSSWSMTEYTLGTQPTYFSDGAIPAALAQHFFQDSTPNTPIDSAAFYTREEVFTKLGLTINPFYWVQPVVPTLAAPSSAASLESVDVPAHSVAYLRALAEGRTLTQLIATEGRDALQTRLVAHAWHDPGFAYNLERRPIPTIAAFFGVQIDEAARITVVVETPSTFGIVIPQTT